MMSRNSTFLQGNISIAAFYVNMWKNLRQFELNNACTHMMLSIQINPANTKFNDN